MTDAVLLTGASGYVGGALAQTLGRAGRNVVLAGRGGDCAVGLDLNDPVAIRESVLPKGVSALVHCAALNEIACASDPVAAFTANVTATRVLLDAAIVAGVDRLIYLSTFHVFGRPAGILTESVAPEPANDYGATHRFAEELFLMAARARGVRAYILRPSNLYGAPASWERFGRWTLAPFDFMRQALTTGEVVLRTDGSPIRNYVSLEALGRTVLAALAGELGAGVVHVAGRSWSMLALAQRVADVARGLGAGEIRIHTGNVHPEEAPYSFGSVVQVPEADDDGARMDAFLKDVARYLLSVRRLGHE